MKASGVCPKCAGARIVHLEYVLDAGDWTGAGSGPAPDRQGHQHVPRQLAAFESTEESVGLFGGVSTRTVQHTVTTEAYVCADCGLVEEHVVGPQEVPWDRVRGARWHRPIVR